MEYYNAAVLGGGVRSTPEFKAPAPVAAASGDLILPAYKSLGAVYQNQKESSPPQGERERKKKMSNGTGGGMTVPGSGTAKTRSSQHLAERSFSVTETNSRQGGTGHNLSSSSQSRTPHRTAGYGGAGQPNRGPHRFHQFFLMYLWLP